MKRRWMLLLGCVLVAAQAHAVIVTTGDGSGNTTAPADDPGFASVGVKGDSAVHLGGGWVLTANHSGAGSVWLGGVNYSVAAGSTVQLVHDDSFDTDLLLFRLEDLPDLPALEIAAQPPVVGEEVVLIGNGINRAASASHWNSDWNEVDPVGGFSHRGWKSSNGRSVRWGRNEIDTVDRIISVLGTRNREFIMDFDDVVDQAQAINGDSGGAVFVKRSGQWKLLGILNFVQFLPGQPANTAVVGNRSYAIDLSYYRDQLLELIPPMPTEVPASSSRGLLAVIALFVAVGLGVLDWRSRRVLHKDR